MRKCIRIVSVLSLFFAAQFVAASPGRVRSVYLDDQKIEPVAIKPGRLTALHFPVKPENSALGMKGAFDLTYIGNDIVVGALRPLASTNLLVYLLGRRFTFELTSRADGSHDEIVNILDADTPKPKPPLGVPPIKVPKNAKKSRGASSAQLPTVTHE